MGKTALALKIAIDAAIEDKKTVCFFSSDSDSIVLVKRTLAYLTGLHILRLSQGFLNEEGWIRLISAIDILKESNLHIVSPARTIDDIEAICEQIQPALIVVDSLQMLQNHSPRTTRYRNLNEILQRLSSNGLPVVLTSSLHRRLEYRADKRPCLSDFYETEMTVNASDKILMLYRDEVYNETTTERGIMEIICAQNRSGPIGKVRAAYDLSIGRIFDVQLQACRKTGT